MLLTACVSVQAPTVQDKTVQKEESKQQKEVATLTPKDTNICESMAKDSQDRAECYWELAMQLKDKSLCDKIMPYTSGNKEQETMSAENCKNEISYKTENADWRLQNGIPPYADPTALTYAGKAHLKGWIVAVPFYVGDPEPHFHVAKESIKDLPLSMQLNGREDFVLFMEGRDGKYLKAEPQEYEDLKQYTEKNPVTIEITKTGFAYVEGSPFMYFVQIVNP